MVTATSDRRRDPQVGLGVAGWGQRSVFGTVRGWPWWAAVLLALGLSIIGAVIDMHLSGELDKVFEGAYFIGCVGAVCLVRRRNVFGPMVQPPLILAVTVPVAVLLAKGMPSGSGTASKLIALGVPLVTGFPTMAITTGATVVIGGLRFLIQRKPAEADRAEAGSRRGQADSRRRNELDIDDVGDRPARSGQDRRPRPADGSGRPVQERPGQDRPGQDRGVPDRAPRDDRGVPRDRTRVQQPPGGNRGDAPDGVGRPGAGRAGAGRPGPDRDRGQPPRSGQSRDRDRGQPLPPRTGRPTRDDDRRQPPRRRADDY